MKYSAYSTIFALGLSVSLNAFSAENHSFDEHLRGAQGQKFHTEVFFDQPAGLTPGTFKQNIDHSGLLPGQTLTNATGSIPSTRLPQARR